MNNCYRIHSNLKYLNVIIIILCILYIIHDSVRHSGIILMNILLNVIEQYITFYIILFNAVHFPIHY